MRWNCLEEGGWAAQHDGVGGGRWVTGEEGRVTSPGDLVGLWSARLLVQPLTLGGWTVCPTPPGVRTYTCVCLSGKRRVLVGERGWLLDLAARHGG